MLSVIELSLKLVYLAYVLGRVLEDGMLIIIIIMLCLQYNKQSAPDMIYERFIIKYCTYFYFFISVIFIFLLANRLHVIF